MIQYLDGNRLTLLRSGAEYFPALEDSIDQARTEIYLETYIFADDQSGRSIATALCRASQRGVRVHVLLDGFGAKDMPKHLSQTMLDAGVGLLVYRRKISPLTLRRHRLRRDRRLLGGRCWSRWRDRGRGAGRRSHALSVFTNSLALAFGVFRALGARQAAPAKHQQNPRYHPRPTAHAPDYRP